MSADRKAIVRALPLCLTICAARSSVRPTVWACSPAEKRSSAGSRRLGQVGLARRYGGRGLFRPRRQLAAGALVAHTQPCGERAGIRPGWPSATGSGPSVIFEVLTVRTPPSTVCAKRSMLRGAGPSSLILMPSRS